MVRMVMNTTLPDRVEGVTENLLTNVKAEKEKVRQLFSLNLLMRIFERVFVVFLLSKK